MKPLQDGRKPLNVRQERFAELVVSGLSATEAYIQAGYKVTVKSAGTNGPRLLENAAIRARVAELRAPQTAAALMTKDRKRQILAGIAEDPKSGLLARIRAIEVDAKLAGDFEPDQVVVETGPKTLDALEARAKEVVSALDRRRQK
ncbi:terminase small subunit [Luteolibacter yonseiensis]|uniref:Terminase small subunit n=1 Tax=Luteolibacter yonseiensis TaxID=1144680 RepID=A0A934R796_9BACT|nr:terminase small subunit [Luteolibacter yonseiensis]MBK1817501.1 terminase small subunit [Luteolibacter yonseiensis]